MIVRNIPYSAASWAMTGIVMAVLAAALVALAAQGDVVGVCSAGVAVVALAVLALWYAPVALVLTDDELVVRRPLRSTVISLAGVAGVRMGGPSPGTVKGFESHGFFGHWGWVNDPRLDRYFCYYGRYRQCFMVFRDDGMNYMLGCAGAASIVEEIRRRADNLRSK